MTRSSAHRRNRNARSIAVLVPARDAMHHRNSEGAFTPAAAQQWVRNASPYLWPEPPQETNWELCAELLNSKVRRVVERELRVVAEIIGVHLIPLGVGA